MSLQGSSHFDRQHPFCDAIWCQYVKNILNWNIMSQRSCPPFSVHKRMNNSVATKYSIGEKSEDQYIARLHS